MSNADQKFVVVRKADHVRISGKIHETRELASQEAQRLTESIHQPSEEFEVKQIIEG